ncbi:MAG: dodecin family protein [Thermoproteota archaeon]
MPVLKVIELVGVSEKGWQEAVEEAVKRASKTIRNIQGVDVLGWTGKVEGDEIVEYRVDVKVSFLVEHISG